MKPPVLWLFASDLYSKWGFNDGDEPEAILDYLDAHHPHFRPGLQSWHAALRHLVRTRLLPALEQKVIVEEIPGIHNPIRAVSVNGLNVENASYRPELVLPTLTPESIKIEWPLIAAALGLGETS